MLKEVETLVGINLDGEFIPPSSIIKMDSGEVDRLLKMYPPRIKQTGISESSEVVDTADPDIVEPPGLEQLTVDGEVITDKMVRHLKDAMFYTLEDIRDASVYALTRARTVGDVTAEKLKKSADSLVAE